MTELELQQYLLREYPQENARCEWKELYRWIDHGFGDRSESGWMMSVFRAKFIPMA